MEKLKMHSPDFTQENIAKLAALFPNCVTEAKDESGNVKRAIDFDQLRQELSNHVVDGPRERYQLNWPGKREALLAANAPIAKTLRPCRKESVDFDTTKNLFIEGDNLDALKLLQETYLNKVKVIYIDPPYNTGNDFVYEDDFSEDTDSYFRKSSQTDSSGGRLFTNTETNGRFHSDWLSMVYSRLKHARQLLREDGLFFVSVNDSEAARLKQICDEVFGEENFVAQIVWKKSYGGGAKSKHAVVLHEYILFYAKSKLSLGSIELPPSDEVLKYYKFKDDKFPARGPYRKQPLATNSMDGRPNLRFPIKHQGEEIWPEKQWQWSEPRVREALMSDELVFTKKTSGWTVDYKQYLKNKDGETRGSKLYSVLDGPYTQSGTAEIARHFGNGKVFTFPKPSKLIEHLLRCAGDDGIVLDFFAGSGTTAEAVVRLNANDNGRRKFVLVQFPEGCGDKSDAYKSGFRTIAEIGKERIRRAGKKIKDEAGLQGQDLDIGFRVLKVDTSNMKDVYYKPDALDKNDLFDHVENIKEDRTPDDLLFQVLLDWGVDLSLPIRREQWIVDNGKLVAAEPENHPLSTASSQLFNVFFVDDNALAACFDTGVTEELVKKIAAHKPLRVVFRDAGFSDDSVKINVEQIFKLMSPDTEVRSI